jgi:hypothetical protein
MLFAATVFTTALVLLPSVQADMPAGNWRELDCWVGKVSKGGKVLPENHAPHYDWQLTAQACKNNYAPEVVSNNLEKLVLICGVSNCLQAKYSMGRGRVRSFPLIRQIRS